MICLWWGRGCRFSESGVPPRLGIIWKGYKMIDVRSNKSVRKAAKVKDDEFYTRLEDVAAEVGHYECQFRGKRVYLPCDDYRTSQFWRFFVDNFKRLGIKQVVALGFGTDAHLARYDGILTVERGAGGGFDSDTSLREMRICDIIVTNPPFSLFRKFLKTVLCSGKEFLVMAGLTSLSYRDCWVAYRDGLVTTGVNNGRRVFDRPGGGTKSAPITWWTNLYSPPRSGVKLVSYVPGKYEKYDNLDALEVPSLKEVPDTGKLLGVPVQYLLVHNPEQFEIVGAFNGGVSGAELGAERVEIQSAGKSMKFNGPVVKGKAKFFRYVIRRVDKAV